MGGKEKTTPTLNKSESIALILDYLKDNPASPGISNLFFMEASGSSSRTTFYNIKAALEAFGYIFSDAKAGKTAYYKIENLDELYDYQIPTENSLYKYLIIETLNKHPEGMLFQNPIARGNRDLANNPLSKKYLCDELYIIRSESKNDFSDDTTSFNASPVDMQVSRFRALLKEMEMEGLISITRVPKLGDVYTSNVQNTLLACSIETLTSALSLLEQIPSGHKAYDLLSSIRNKFKLEILHSLEGTNNDKNYIVYGPAKKSYASIMDDIKLLNNIDYKTHVIKVTYEESGITSQMLLALGAIVYSEISSEIYLIGKTKITTTDEGNYIYIQFSKISQIQPTEIPNEEFLPSNKHLYDAMINSMLDISVSEPQKLQADFVVDYLPTMEKLSRLYASRKDSSKLTPHREHMKTVSTTYEDSISDYDTLLPYLLGFGRACKVNSPGELSNKIKDELEITLQEYEKEGFDV